MSRDETTFFICIISRIHEIWKCKLETVDSWPGSCFCGGFLGCRFVRRRPRGSRGRGLKRLLPLALLSSAPSFSAKLWRARSRLYQDRFLETNTHFARFFEFYKFCILLHFFLNIQNQNTEYFNFH